MGNCISSKTSKPAENKEKFNLLQTSDYLNEKNNLIIEDKNTPKNKKNLYFGEQTESITDRDFYNLLQEIDSGIKSLKKNEIKYENNEKNNHYFNSFPMYSGDYVLERMKNEWIEKEKKKFKNQIKSEIKGNIVLPEVKNLKSEIDKINELISTNNEQINLQIKNETNTIKKYIEIEKEKSNNETKSKIENLTKKNENIIESMKKEFKNQFENLKNIFDSKVTNLINQINNNKVIFEQYKNETQIEIKNLKEQIQTEKAEKEALKRQISLQIKNSENTLNSQIKTNKEENNKKFGEIYNKININGETLKNLKNEITVINNTLRQKTQKIINQSFGKFGDTLKKLYQINKHKRQQELKHKLFLDKNYAKVGLNNIGNNCYINSVLQILKNIPKFTYNFFKLNNIKDSFLLSLKDLLINLCKSNISSFPPNEFKKYLGIENKKFAGSNQYDSTIFYVSLLNIIAKKLLNVPSEKMIKNSDTDNNKDKNDKNKFDIYKEHYFLKHRSFIHEFFYIFFSNKYYCESCHNSNEIFQSTNYLDFPVVTEKGPVKNLEECFENFQVVREINSECSECQCEKINQNFIIYELPPVLIINLKRVGESSAYFNDIEIPFQLDMSKIIQTIKINSVYELRGFIKHEGDEKFGHNYSYCKNMFDDKWYEYSDAICTPIDGEPKLNKIFFLCYIKIGNDIDNIEYLKQII